MEDCMDFYEMAIMSYIATDRSTFLVPQYDIEEGNQSWASLDFLGINCKRKKVYIVEVNSSANIRGLFDKVEEMFETGKHVERLRKQIHEDYGGEFDEWPMHVAVFARERETKTFENLLGTTTLKEKVHVFQIEECIFPWKYWE